MVLNLIYKSKSTNHKNNKTGAVKALVFFVAFVERGRKKRHLKIHFTMDYVLKETEGKQLRIKNYELRITILTNLKLCVLWYKIL